MMLGLGDLHQGMKDRAQVLNVNDAVEKQGTLKGYLGSGPSSQKSSLADGQIQAELGAAAAGERQETSEDVRKARSVLAAGVQKALASKSKSNTVS